MKSFRILTHYINLVNSFDLGIVFPYILLLFDSKVTGEKKYKLGFCSNVFIF